MQCAIQQIQCNKKVQDILMPNNGWHLAHTKVTEVNVMLPKETISHLPCINIFFNIRAQTGWIMVSMGTVSLDIHICHFSV